MARARPDNPGLMALYWRDEILQLLYWLAGEGLAENASAEELAAFLHEDAHEIGVALRMLHNDGYLTAENRGRYAMTLRGRDHGRRAFSDEFAGMTGQAHGECADDCWCHTSAERAQECLTNRTSHH